MNEFIGQQNLLLDILYDFLAVPQNEIITQFVRHFVRNHVRIITQWIIKILDVFVIPKHMHTT